MKFNIEKNELLAALTTVGKAVRTKTTLPVLECVCLKSTGMSLILEATNMEFAIRTEIPCIADLGSVCIEAKQLSDILKKMPDTSLTIEVTENYSVTIYAGKKIKFSIQGRDPEAFPEIREEEGNSIIINGEVLKEAVAGVAFCASTNETSKIMTGIQLKISGNNARFCGLDGHRIGIRTVILPAPSDKDYNIIIPSDYLTEIARVIPSEDVELTINEKNVMFKVSNILITTRLIVGEYYKVETMLSKEFKTSVELNREDLFATVDRAQLVLKDEIKRPVIFNISDEKPLNVSGSSNVGKIEEEIEVSSKNGDDLIIGLNPSFILDALKAISDETVKLNFVGGDKFPLVIKDTDETFTYLILPVTIKK